MSFVKSFFKKIFSGKAGKVEYKHKCQRCGQKYIITPGKNKCPKCKTPYYLNLPK